jgi:hypothetical protein
MVLGPLRTEVDVLTELERATPVTGRKALKVHPRGDTPMTQDFTRPSVPIPQRSGQFTAFEITQYR